MCKFVRSPNDPLKWWRDQSKYIPNLWKLASEILTIPATSAQSERVFSIASLVVDQKRARIKSENVNMQVFLKDNPEFIEWDILRN